MEIICGVADCAAMMGVSHARIGALRKQGRWPEPDFQTATTDRYFWRLAVVEQAVSDHRARLVALGLAEPETRER